MARAVTGYPLTLRGEMMNDFANDIPLETARLAHHGTSFSPDRRAEQEREGYAETLRNDYERLSTHADTDEKRALLDDEFARYHEGYRRRTLAYLHSRSRLVSWMIAGPSGFPAARMEKRGDITHKRLTELLEFRERALQAITRKLHPELRPIMSGDSDAVERLEAEIRAAERLQETMKKANAIIRREPKYKPTAEKQVELLELGVRRAGELFKEDFCGRIGFADYELRNSSANIRRMKERLARIAAAKAAPDTSAEGQNATIEDCPAENRVRLFFPGKPAADVRAKLKSSGFRWAPSLNCWQAYRNYRSQQVAREVAGV